MKPIQALTLVLALAMLMAPLLVARPANAASGIYYTVNPVAIAPLTDTNPSAQILETPTTPSPVGQFFDVEIHLIGATLANLAAGVGGVEVHFDFSTILSNAAPIGFTDMLGESGGVLVGPQSSLLFGIPANFFQADGVTKVTSAPYLLATQFIVAAASTNGPWNGADGIIAVIHFKITAQPSGVLMQPDFVGALTLTTGTGVVDGAANPIALDDPLQGTLHIDASPFNYPAAPAVFITPTAYTGTGALGTTFNYTVMITADSFWDVAGFDIQVNYNDSVMNLVAYSEGGFLQQGGADTYGFWYLTNSSVEGIFTKLSDATPSAGTDSLMQLEFNITYVAPGYSNAAYGVTLCFVDLASWAHPERTIAPWNGYITAVDLSPFPGWTMANATYTPPYLIVGPNIDLYDQYPAPYGGQGQNQHSDSFAPQQEVCLYAKVTYGGDRVTNKLVTFEVHDALGNKITILQNYSDINGIATVCFRIPQTDLIPGGEDPSIFGWWNVTTNVEIDGVIVTDTMPFQVGWLAQITSVTANGAPYHKYTDNMNFTAVLVTIHEQPIYVLVSIDSYDSQGYPIGESTQYIYVNATRATCPFTGPLTTTTGGVYYLGPYIQGIPTWARVGTASVIGYALTDYPRNGGVPWGPQSPATYFGITVP